MAKYHMNNHNEPARCEAKNSCPLGGDDMHFEGSLREAVSWAEQKNTQTFGDGGNFSSGVSKSPVAEEQPLPGMESADIGKTDLEYDPAKNRGKGPVPRLKPDKDWADSKKIGFWEHKANSAARIATTVHRSLHYSNMMAESEDTDISLHSRYKQKASTAESTIKSYTNSYITAIAEKAKIELKSKQVSDYNENDLVAANQLNDHELKNDLGITRADLYEELNQRSFDQPQYVNPDNGAIIADPEEYMYSVGTKADFAKGRRMMAFRSWDYVGNRYNYSRFSGVDNDQRELDQYGTFGDGEEAEKMITEIYQREQEVVEDEIKQNLHYELAKEANDYYVDKTVNKEVLDVNGAVSTAEEKHAHREQERSDVSGSAMQVDADKASESSRYQLISTRSKALDDAYKEALKKNKGNHTKESEYKIRVLKAAADKERAAAAVATLPNQARNIREIISKPKRRSRIPFAKRPDVGRDANDYDYFAKKKDTKRWESLGELNNIPPREKESLHWMIHRAERNIGEAPYFVRIDELRKHADNVAINAVINHQK